MNLQFLNTILLAILAAAEQFTMFRTANYYILQYKVNYLTVHVYHTYSSLSYKLTIQYSSVLN